MVLSGKSGISHSSRTGRMGDEEKVRQGRFIRFDARAVATFEPTENRRFAMRWTLRSASVAAVLACLVAAASAQAGGHTSRTYMGDVGMGPYKQAPRYQHPRTYKIFGFRCTSTPAERYERFLREYTRLEYERRAKHANLRRDLTVRYIEGYRCVGDDCRSCGPTCR